MFGLKKRTVDDILSDIEKLTDEEKFRILGALSGDSESSDADPSESEEPETVAESAEGAEAGSDETSAEAAEPPENSSVDVETDESEEVDGNSEEGEPLPQETPEEMPAEELPVEEIPAQAAAPAADSAEADNTRELIEAQVAKINALESEIGALKEKIDNIVSNQDKQNFGLSPSADFSGDESSERRNAVLRGYAGRRANDYK